MAMALRGMAGGCEFPQDWRGRIRINGTHTVLAEKAFKNVGNERNASRIGSMRVYGPEDWLGVMDEAISKVKEEDPVVYAGVSGGRNCFVFTPHRKIESWLPFGLFFLNRPFVKSQGALVSLFVFWHFFEEGSSIFERADSEKVESRKRQASERTAEWLEVHKYSAELVQWIKAGGLEKGIEPPLPSKKRPNGPPPKGPSKVHVQVVFVNPQQPEAAWEI